LQCVVAEFSRQSFLKVQGLGRLRRAAKGIWSTRRSAPVTTESLGAIAVRLLYAIAITAPAWYTAKESARHRTNSDRARQTELELASLGPFIELLPDDKKEKIREEMTKLYFGRDIQPHTASSPLESATFKELAELVKSIKG